VTSAKPAYERRSTDQRRQDLIDAGIRCLSKDGIGAFTIDRISKEARVSRGLINHHFDGIDDLLAAVYVDMTSAMHGNGSQGLSAAGSAEERLAALLKFMFSPPIFAKGTLRAWLALWGEVAANSKLKLAHRQSYERYLENLSKAIAEITKARKCRIDHRQLAITCIALIDGLWLEWCLNPSAVSRDDAEDAVYAVLESRLGPLQR
jgi:AcrR family transcriptional regulator